MTEKLTQQEILEKWNALAPLAEKKMRASFEATRIPIETSKETEKPIPSEPKKEAPRPAPAKIGPITEKVADGITRGAEGIAKLAWPIFWMIMLVLAPLLLNTIFAGLGVAPLSLFAFEGLNVFNLFSIPGFDVSLPFGPIWMATTLWTLIGGLVAYNIGAKPTKQFLVENFTKGGKDKKEERRKKEKISKAIGEGKIRPGDPEYDSELDPRSEHETSAVGIKFAWRQARGLFRALFNIQTAKFFWGPLAVVMGGLLLAGKLTFTSVVIPFASVLVPWLQTAGVFIAAPTLLMVLPMILAWGLLFESTHRFPTVKFAFKKIGEFFGNMTGGKKKIVFEKIPVLREEPMPTKKVAKNPAPSKASTTGV